ncbi:MAG: YafY family protein [Nannocystaceae bacterium]
MRRADRLFLLIQALRGRRTPITASELARSVEVSARTIYRDVADLQRSGVPIEGEAGVGYVLRRGADIPPLMFDPEELEALVIGSRFVRAFAGERLTAAARRALIKIEAVLPAERRRQSERSRVYAPPTRRTAEDRARMDRLHVAIAERCLVRFAYVREDGAASRREVEPICLAFWGYAWTLGAYCRLRRDFRNFRLDRIEALDVGEERFDDDPRRGLEAYMRSLKIDPDEVDKLS